MNVKWTKRILIGLGCCYLVALAPAAIKPQWTKSPLRKPNAEISVPVDAGNLDQRIKEACEVPTLFRPLMQSAQKVRVISTTNDGVPVGVHEYDCVLYVS